VSAYEEFKGLKGEIGFWTLQTLLTVLKGVHCQQLNMSEASVAWICHLSMLHFKPILNFMVLEISKGSANSVLMNMWLWSGKIYAKHNTCTKKEKENVECTLLWGILYIKVSFIIFTMTVHLMRIQHPESLCSMGQRVWCRKHKITFVFFKVLAGQYAEGSNCCFSRPSSL
jgi:hypothetical protein